MAEDEDTNLEAAQLDVKVLLALSGLADDHAVSTLRLGFVQGPVGLSQQV
jgi:hypothetical protein